MADLKDLIVNGAARIIGKTYSSEFVGNVTGNVTGNAKTATTADKTAYGISVKDAASNLAVNGWNGSVAGSISTGSVSAGSATIKGGGKTTTINPGNVSTGSVSANSASITNGEKTTTIAPDKVTTGAIEAGSVTIGGSNMLPVIAAIDTSAEIADFNVNTPA